MATLLSEYTTHSNALTSNKNAHSTALTNEKDTHVATLLSEYNNHSTILINEKNAHSTTLTNAKNTHVATLLSEYTTHSNALTTEKDTHTNNINVFVENKKDEIANMTTDLIPRVVAIETEIPKKLATTTYNSDKTASDKKISDLETGTKDLPKLTLNGYVLVVEV